MIEILKINKYYDFVVTYWKQTLETMLYNRWLDFKSE